MKSVFDWFLENPGSTAGTWLILGKGPSFAKREEFDLSRFRCLALNDAARELAVDIAHAIDIQVIERSGEAIAKNARVLVMPWHPHVNFDAGAATLEEHARRHAVLRRLADEGRLLWYNLSTTRDHRPKSPVVSARFFSAEAAVNLLAAAGVGVIRSLGVDGGASYSKAFEDLKGKSLLANRRSTFDEQFGEIAKTIQRTGIDFAPLDVESPIRIYVAATEAQMLAVRVLEYSIRKHASMSVRVSPLHASGIDIPSPREKKNWARTPFTFQRFLVPEAAGRRGRALYLDSDMQVFQDIRRLWLLPLDGADVCAVGDTSGTGRRPQFSVMLLDCAALDWDIRDIVARLDSGTLTYDELVYDMKVARAIRTAVPPEWNSLETFRHGETALLHYTDMETQPWVDADNRNGYLWVRDLIEAIDAGFIALDYVREHVAKGWVRPSLLWQIQHREEDGLLLPRAARAMDAAFRAPYLEIQRSTKAWRAGRKALQDFYRRSALYRLQRRIAARLSRR